MSRERNDVYDVALNRSISINEYVLEVECENCRFRGNIVLYRGHAFDSQGKCPQCGCSATLDEHKRAP